MPNNNHLISLQESGGKPSTPGNVTVEFYGHSAVTIVSPNGMRVLMDPWRNDPSGVFGTWFTRDFPAIPVDLVVSTHAHFDHDAVMQPQTSMILERPVGRYRFADVSLTGLVDKHLSVSEGKVDWVDMVRRLGAVPSPPDNDPSFDNTIQIVTTGGLRIAHWGDNRAQPSAALDKALRGLDVLILPIDGSEHILSHAWTNAIIEKYEPKAVIPSHYFIKDLTTVESTLESADSWVATQPDVVRIRTGVFVFNAKELRGARGRVYYFGDDTK